MGLPGTFAQPPPGTECRGLAMAGDTPVLWALRGHSHGTQGTRSVRQSHMRPHKAAESPLVLVPPAVGDACAVAKEHV